MKIKKTPFVLAALLVGSLYAVSALAIPDRSTVIDVYYDTAGNVVGQRVYADMCDSGAQDWGVTTTKRKRVITTCVPELEF
jgi:Family of unknown function (DUF6289)